MFRPRAKKEKRKRTPLEEDEGSDEISLKDLREMKEDLARRERDKLLKTAGPSTEKAHKVDATSSTLDGQFTVQSNLTPADHYAKIMNTYVEAKLQEKYKLDEPKVTAPALTREQELYRMPDELRKKMSLPETAPEGGMVTWNTGITEVELPQTVLDQVVEATKEALERQQLHEATHKVSSALPTNVSANFKQHKHDYINDLKSRPKEEQRAKGFRHVNKDAPSDDRVMHQFRREQSRRRR
ncbi:hypothetical protein ACHHYP_04950 [Achlya hypogyna]|uniref:Hepatocellular carcinoma-associated antigen 59 n=1 Tax=Achlya hypogyna TaxID=1202772 RepID=A0A1V9YZN3_ACHHY|nr:hypothetical protein ACHHYP_04950 [Achlya hypogyna]